MTTRSRPTARTAGLMMVWLACAPVAAQPTVTFEQMVHDLGSPQAGVRMIAATALKASAYPEAALPLARVVVDPEDAVQLEAIAGEMHVFLAEKLDQRRRVGLVVEVRNRIVAESVFDSGPPALDPRPVPPEVVRALRTASHDENPRVAIEAMYAFGSLAPELTGGERRQMLSESAVELAASVGVSQADLRAAAVRVIGRVYAFRPGDPPVNETVGDAVVLALNDRSSAIRAHAMDALGAMRYARALQALTDLVQHHERGPVAAAAFEALARIGHPSSRALFEQMLESRDATMRRIAVEAVGRLADPALAGRVNGVMAQERNADVLLAGHFATVLMADGPVDELVEGLSRSRHRTQAFRYLLEVAPGRGHAIGVHIQDPDQRVRLDLVDILGMSGDPQALNALERVLQDPEPAVSRAAGRAIVRVRAASARP